MAVAQIDRGSHLAAAFQEVGGAALTVGVVEEHTVAHLTIALHLHSAYASADEGVCVADIGGVGCPESSFVDQQVVVVAHLVALMHHGVGVVDVILYAWVQCVVFAQCVGVDVVERLCSQQVVHGDVVHALVGCELESDVQS